MSKHKKMVRLFVAIPMPSVVQKEVARIQKKIQSRVSSARFVALEKLHCTLAFIGQVPATSVSVIDGTLTTIAQEPFLLTLGMLDFFAAQEQGTAVIFCHLISPELSTVAQAVSTAVAPWAKNEDRSFVGHVTVARTERDGDYEELIQLRKDVFVEPITFTVDRFVLYRSHSTKQGSIYTAVSSYYLQ